MITILKQQKKGRVGDDLHTANTTTNVNFKPYLNVSMDVFSKSSFLEDLENTKPVQLPPSDC